MYMLASWNIGTYVLNICQWEYVSFDMLLDQKLIEITSYDCIIQVLVSSDNKIYFTFYVICVYNSACTFVLK